MKKRRLLWISFALVSTVVLLVPAVRSTPANATSILGSTAPTSVTDPDRVWVELGVKFQSSVNGQVTGIRFYKGPANTGEHVGTLWSSSGRRLATVTFGRETATGWQEASFAAPVTINRGTTYVASYDAPGGAYSADPHGFDHSIRSSSLTVPVGGGLYNYERGGFPQNNWQNSNYYVDVAFRPSTTGSTTASPTSTTSKPTTSSRPTTSSAPSSKPTATSSTTSSPTAGSSAMGGLARVPWEGGSSYWSRFSKTATAGWTSPKFFPTAVWWGGISSNSEVQYDKTLGLNTYVLLNPATPYKLLADNNMFYVGGRLNPSFTDQSTNWVGQFLDDEVDGRFSPVDGRAHLQQLSDEAKGSGRFRYANFTSGILTSDYKPSDAEAYVNNYTDAISIDQYFYTVPQCGWSNYRDAYIIAVPQATCRTSSSYGKTVSMLRRRDATDNKLQSTWQFVELMAPEGPEKGFTPISGDQVKGAVMSSIINEARGIIYFNQSFSGPCPSGNIIRQSQVTAGFCSDGQVAAAKTVNAQIKQLAPVINTQSYAYSFGSGLNTMVKYLDGSAYVFAMTDGTGGGRKFTLPAGIHAKSAQVMFENRTIPITGDTWSDTFAHEYSYHVYKIDLS